MCAAISYIFTMNASVYKKWHIAFLHLIKKEKRGIQARLAEITNTSNRHISDVALGKRGASQLLQEELSKALGHSYEEMLQIGSELLGTQKEPFENYDKIMRLPIVERAWAILRQAAEVHDIAGYLGAMGDPRSKKKPDFMKAYLAGEQTEAELYEESLKRFEDVVKRIEEAMKEQGIE